MRRDRLRRLVSGAGTVVLVVVLLIWWLLPVYNMLLIALDPEGDTEFTGDIWPTAPTLEAFRGVLFKRYWYLQDFWHQFGNSFFIGVMTMALTVLISSLASFALGRMRLRQGRGDLDGRAPHLHGPGVFPGHPVLPADAQLWADRHPVGGRSRRT